MSIKLNDGIFVEGPKPAEDKRLKDSTNGKVPYASVAEACSLILKVNRYPSLVVCIGEGTENKLYIWKDGIEDTDLVPLKTGDDVTPVTTRIKGGSEGTFVDGDITLLGGTNTEVTQTDKTITINSSYNVSVATASVSGVVKLFSNTVQTASSPAVSTTAGKSYGVQLNEAGQMVVNVPWSDTNNSYSAGTGLTLTGSVFSVNYGTTAGTAAQGNDSRFHNPVTISTANGLSLSTQALSLALATPSSAGAMSAADKTKLDGLGTDRYSADFGVVGTLSYPISHGLGQQFVIVQIFEKSTDNPVEMGVSFTSDSVVTISMNQAPTVANQYRIVVLK